MSVTSIPLPLDPVTDPWLGMCSNWKASFAIFLNCVKPCTYTHSLVRFIIKILSLAFCTKCEFKSSVFSYKSSVFSALELDIIWGAKLVFKTNMISSEFIFFIFWWKWKYLRWKNWELLPTFPLESPVLAKEQCEGLGSSVQYFNCFRC